MKRVGCWRWKSRFDAKGSQLACSPIMICPIRRVKTIPVFMMASPDTGREKSVFDCCRHLIVSLRGLLTFRP